MKKGSNQHKKKFKNRWKIYLYGYLIFVGILVFSNSNFVVEAPTKLLSPLAHAQEIGKFDAAMPQTEQEKIKAYIIEIFGKDAKMALKLLECENRSLDSSAISATNDYGVFQINSYWQGVSNVKFLKNYKINIEMAKQLFDESGGKFSLWTCGKEMKI